VLSKKEGIEKVDVDILKSTLTVIFDPSLISSQKIVQYISTTGMKAEPFRKGSNKYIPSRAKYKQLIFAAVSFIFLVAGVLVHLIHHLSFTELLAPSDNGTSIPTLSKIFYLFSIFIGIWRVFPKAYFAVRQIRPDINLLIIIAILGAIGIGQWFEAATVAFLFSLAIALEEFSVETARGAISSLLELAPMQANKIDPETGNIVTIFVEEVAVGSVILIRPGEKIPLDGVVVKGSSFVDQSTITGESIPVLKEKGEEVFAGTLNKDGALEVEVTKLADESTLSKIIHLVDEAKEKRSPKQQWIERFAKIYTPIMMVLALILMIFPPLVFHLPWYDWIYRGLVLLIIACPCALVISTPISIVSGLTAAAKSGVLIKGGIFLESVGKINALALDKTGTITFGHPEVQKIVPMNHHTESDLLALAASLEQKSEHPLARAILKKATQENISLYPTENFSIIKGKGAQASLLGENFWIGSHRFMHEKGQETPQVHDITLTLEDAGHSVVAIGTDDHVCGLISVADSPRPNIQKILSKLKELGVKKIVMLTGDNEPTAKALATVAGVDKYCAELLPEDKVLEVEKLKKQYQYVGMVGDGVNDAPALAAANIGIAMGGMGTDTAIETADIALISDDLSKIPWLMRHSRRTVTMIMQNIFFSLGIKALFIILAIFNLTTLWMAIAADTGVTVLVVFNALRLLKHRIAV
jgi:Zn2+/Cd2+-exporting ATPase